MKVIFIHCIPKMICMKKKAFSKDAGSTNEQDTQQNRQAVISEVSDSGGKGIKEDVKETTNALANPFVQAFLDYDNKEQNKEDWQFITLVMNRLFAMFFVLSMVVSTLWIFLQIP